MSHLTLHHVVRLTVATTDTALLDSLEDTLADVPSEVRGPETDAPTRTDREDSDATRLTARVTFASDDEQAASDLYDALIAHDLPADATVAHYRSPVGLADASDVRAWHDDDAECDCGSVWRPDDHTIQSY